jgi:hypothetical protein
MGKATEIEVQELPEDDYVISANGHICEYHLVIRGSIVEDVDVEKDPIERDYFGVYSDQEKANDQLLSFSLSQFVEARVIDIDVSYRVEWNPAIGQVSIEYNSFDKVSSLFIRFTRVGSWQGWPFAFDEYYRSLHNLVELSGVADVELDAEQVSGPCAKFSIDSSLPLKTEVERCLAILQAPHEEVTQQLTAQTNSLALLFDFPQEVRVPCEQYLLYFVQFLQDLGVEATADLRHEAGKVLFAVSPGNKETALDNIRTALQTYLQLPSSPLDTDSIVEYEIAAQRLAANIDHFKGQVRLVNAQLRLADATIQQQQIAIDHLLTKDVVLKWLNDAETEPANDEPEPLFGGTVALTTFEKYGVRVSLGEVFRRLRGLFSEAEDTD